MTHTRDTRVATDASPGDSHRVEPGDQAGDGTVITRGAHVAYSGGFTAPGAAADT